MFILTFRSDIAYERWWEGGTLLQKTRGEWQSSQLMRTSEKLRLISVRQVHAYSAQACTRRVGGRACARKEETN